MLIIHPKQIENISVNGDTLELKRKMSRNILKSAQVVKKDGTSR